MTTVQGINTLSVQSYAPEQVSELVGHSNTDEVKRICANILYEQDQPPVLKDLYGEWQHHEAGLSPESHACLLASAMHGYLTRHLVAGKALGNADDERDHVRLEELKSLLISNVMEAYERGNTDPAYKAELRRDLLYLRTVAVQPVNPDVGSGASLLLELHEQSRRVY